MKILDFGLARARPESAVHLDASTGLKTAPGSVMGTLGYMSPEQLRGEVVQTTTDIFALGCILYEMVSGQAPFARSSGIDTAAAILHDEPPDPAGTGIPQELVRMIRRCLAKTRSERYQSARDLGFDLRALMTDSRISPVTDRSVPVRRGAVILTLSAVLLLLIVTLAWRRPWRSVEVAQPALTTPIRSIAVLPLNNLSGDPEQEYFAEGMTDALIATLAQVRTLKAISRTSVMRFKNTRNTVPEIGRQLGVDGVLEGSILRSGNRVRITAQLIDAATDTHRWANTYEGELRDILDLQSDVARDVARQIQITLTGEERLLLGQKRAVDPAAHENYLLGRFYWNQRTVGAMKKGLEHFESAIRQDPSYALGFAGIADSYAMLGAYGAMPPSQAFPAARTAAEKALELDPHLPEAHATLLAVNLDYDWNWPGVEREYRRATDLNSSYVFAHQWYAMYLSAMGDHARAIHEAGVTRQLDPLSPLANTHISIVLYHARQYDDALAKGRKVLDLDPNYLPAHTHLGYVYEAMGRYEEAVAERELAVKLTQRQPRHLVLLARSYAFAGRSREARALLAEVQRLPQSEYVSPLDKTWAYVALGDRDQALSSLEAAFRERSWGMYRLKIEPKADPLRSEPRFQAILAAMRFPEPAGFPVRTSR